MIMFFRPLNALLYKGREHKPPEKMGEEAILRRCGGLRHTRVVTLMAVSDWLLLSVCLTRCLASVLGSCLSEVMSFWDLESSRKQIQNMIGGRPQLCRDPRGPSSGTPAARGARPEVP